MALHETAGSVRVPARCAVCYVVDTRIRAEIESSSEPQAAGAVTEPQQGDRPHLPGPSLYPIAFAAGVALILGGVVCKPQGVSPLRAGVPHRCLVFWARETA